MAEITSGFNPEDFKHLLNKDEPPAPPVQSVIPDRPALVADMETPISSTPPPAADDPADHYIDPVRVTVPDTLPQAPSSDQDPADTGDLSSALARMLAGLSDEERQAFITSLSGAAPAPAVAAPEVERVEHLPRQASEREDPVDPEIIRPRRGWRRLLSSIGINVSASPEELEEQMWVDVIRSDIGFPAVIGVSSIKGGSGKTTTSVVMGHALSQARPHSRIVVVDMDPSGNLAQRTRSRQKADVQNYASSVAAGSADPYAFVLPAADNLDFLGSRMDPLTPELTPNEVVLVIEGLMQHYDFVIVDMPQRTDSHSYTAMLSMLDVVVYLFEAKNDALATVGDTRTILDAPATRHLIPRRVIAFNHSRPRARDISPGDHFNPGEVVDHLLTVEEVEVVELGYNVNLFWSDPIEETVLGSDGYRRFVQLTAAAVNMVGDTPPASRPSLLNY